MGYQKNPRMDLTFWYGTANEIGLKEIMRRKDIENRNKGEGRMMPFPEMKEKDLVRIVKKKKNGKAAGIDGVKAETMKHMVRNRKIRKGLLTAFNKCLKEKINKNWLESFTTMLPKKKKKKKKKKGGNPHNQAPQKKKKKKKKKS